MEKQILAHWIEGFTPAEIANKHNVSVEYVVNAIRRFWL
jgi:DNA-binding CsgD family transcriptional regulator